MPALDAEILAAFCLIGLSPSCRDARLWKETRRRILLDTHPDKLGDASIEAQERFVRMKEALDRVTTFFRDEEDRRAAGLPPTPATDDPTEASTAASQDHEQAPSAMPNRNQLTTRYWFEDAYDELLAVHPQLASVEVVLPEPQPLHTWTQEMNDAVAKWVLLPPTPERGLAREAVDASWTPREACLRAAPSSTEQADYLGPTENETATDQLVCEQDRLRQPRRHLWSKTGGKLGVSIHRRVEDYLETNLLAEEINHDFGVFETPTYRSTMRAYTARRTEHLSKLYVYSEQEQQARQAEVAARLSGSAMVRRPSKAGMSLQELRADTAGAAAYQQHRAEREALRRQQYETRARMQHQLSAVSFLRADLERPPVLAAASRS